MAGQHVRSGDILSRDAVDFMTVLHTGMDHLESVVVPEDKVPLPQEAIKSLIDRWQKSGKPVRWGDYMIRRNESCGSTLFEQVIPIHKNKLGENIRFKLSDESEGILHLLNLSPFLAELKNSQDQTLMVDEFDRSLHANMLEWLIKDYLRSCCSKTANQLIITINNTNILTQNIFRRDELWAIDKNSFGAASIYSFSDFKSIRSDKDIRKIYLGGFMGAVPSL